MGKEKKLFLSWFELALHVLVVNLAELHVPGLSGLVEGSMPAKG